MPYLLWLFGADVDPKHVYPTEWVFVYEIPSEAITLNTWQGFRTRGMIVLPFPKYDVMLIVLVVVKPLLSQAIPVRFSEINYSLAVGKVIDTLTEFVDKIEFAFKGLEVDNKMPSLREAHQEFVAALVTYRDIVLHDILAHAMGSSGDNSSKMGRSTEWGN